MSYYPRPEDAASLHAKPQIYQFNEQSTEAISARPSTPERIAQRQITSVRVPYVYYPHRVNVQRGNCS